MFRNLHVLALAAILFLVGTSSEAFGYGGMQRSMFPGSPGVGSPDWASSQTYYPPSYYGGYYGGFYGGGYGAAAYDAGYRAGVYRRW